jgi:hypothetical protein
MSVSSIVVVIAEIKLAYRKILRPFIAWSAERARKREAKRHGNGPTLPPIALALVIACLLATGCASYDHAIIALDDVLPPQQGQKNTNAAAKTTSQLTTVSP